ncbi:MFS transporter [Litorivicinus lipolyticus]|uniref:MFS transporter n=1 Tax=Litorivicinus lipolyticus TaxID=418701 RepID=A0A5Q2QHA8_9GAMM|nr:MFS transporter [Litorivicinus lipolyticus]QGG80405.1 MFS transporter [Litorivicinus lipolyticus]
MRKELLASWALLVGIGLMMIGNGLQGTLLSVRATLEGFDTQTTGVVMAGYFIGMMIGSAVSAKLIRRVGHIKVFAAAASVASISILIQGSIVDPWVWWLMRIMTGACLAAIYVVSESWLNDRASNENRGALLSVYMLICTLGMGSGQFLLNVAEPTTTSLFILISILVSIASVPILLTARPAPRFDSSDSMSLVKLYRLSPLSVQSNLLTGAAHGTIFGMGAVYAVNKGFSTAEVATFMAAFSLGGLVLQWPIGWASDRYGRRELLLWISLLAAVVAGFVMTIDAGSPRFFLAVTLLGGLVMPMYSLCIAYLNDRLNPSDLVAASGAMLLASGIGLTAGPISVAFLMGQFGDDMFFAAIAIMFVLVALAVLRSKATREVTAQDIEDQSPILTAGPIGSPVAAFNAPDAEEYAVALAEDQLDVLDELASEEGPPEPPR